MGRALGRALSRACAAAILAGCGPASEPQLAGRLSERPASTERSPEPKARAWLDPGGTSIVGFGLLRVVPASGGSAFTVRYRETPRDYGAGTAYQLFVLPGDVFAESENVFAQQFLAFTRSVAGSTAMYELSIEFRAERETTVLVAYGPWTAPDTGRPPGDEPTFTLDVEPASGARFEWIESEAGELITTDWTGRPGVTRGEPVTDPVTSQPVWLEVRPLILYDARLVRAADEPADVAGPPRPETPAAADASTSLAALDLAERTADLAAAAARRDRRIVMTRGLAEKLRRVPIRWR